LRGPVRKERKDEIAEKMGNGGEEEGENGLGKV
jgi:hypothetical protein